MEFEDKQDGCLRSNECGVTIHIKHLFLYIAVIKLLKDVTDLQSPNMIYTIFFNNELHTSTTTEYFIHYVDKSGSIARIVMFILLSVSTMKPSQLFLILLFFMWGCF